VSYRTLRRRFSQTVAAHDWLEGLSAALGIGFFLLAALCVWGIVTAVSSIGETDAGFKTTVGFLQVTRAFAIVLFAIFGFVALGVGWFLSGDVIRRWLRRAGGRA
jgi:hypothetical protein